LGILPVAASNPQARRGIIKLVESFMGHGNAIVDLAMIQIRLKEVHALPKKVPMCDDQDQRSLVEEAAKGMTPRLKPRTHQGHWKDVEAVGAMFELCIEGTSREAHSPGSI